MLLIAAIEELSHGGDREYSLLNLSENYNLWLHLCSQFSFFFIYTNYEAPLSNIMSYADFVAPCLVILMWGCPF